jgi:hypothetical protein
MFQLKLFSVVLDPRILSECPLWKGFSSSALMQSIYRPQYSVGKGMLVEGLFFYGRWKYMETIYSLRDKE